MSAVTKLMLEALGDKIRRAKLDTIAFLKSEWKDKHIIAALNHLSKLSGDSVADIKARVEKRVKEFEEIAVYSKILYEQIAQNIVEGEIFQELQEVSKKHTPDKLIDLNKKHGRKGAAFALFDPIVFRKLCTKIQAENHRFFPMRNITDDLPLSNVRWILVPSTNPQNEKFNSVTTAAASPDGEFIFNVNFMQSLLDYAEIKDLKPKGEKYVNNGGPFAVGYSYIEFLIMHELLHYSQSDFHYGQIFKEVDHTILNWVGDFRSNYDLVKHDFQQLPIGLFSQHVNYDRQNSYEEMIKVVQDELAKLPESLEEKIKKLLKKIMDEHPEDEEERPSGPTGGPSGPDGTGPGPDGTGPTSGTGPGPKGTGPGPDGTGPATGPGPKGTGPGPDGTGPATGPGPDGTGPATGPGTGPGGDGTGPKGTGPGTGPGPKGTGPVNSKGEKPIKGKSAKEIEDLRKKVDDRAKEINNALHERDEKIDKNNLPDGEGGRSSANGNPGKSSTNTSSKYDPAKARPKFSWHQLLDQAVKTAEETEESYARPNRRGISSSVLAKDRGEAAVKPGDIVLESSLKLLIIVDSSGSMTSLLPRIYANLGVLLASKGVNSSFIFMRFSDVHDLWKCDISKNEAISSKGEKTTVHALFSTTYGGGTQLTEALYDDCKEYVADDYNIVMCSDSDIIHSQNVEILKKMVFNLNPYVIFDTISTYRSAAAILKSGINNLSFIIDENEKH